MKPLRALCRLAGAAGFVAASANGLLAEEAQLQPYQMVRSLELVQDRIAGGDHAAMPMQRKLLEMIDARFAADDGTRFDNILNRRALLVYAMSGGNPRTVEYALTKLGQDDPVVQLGDGILAYIRGEPLAARTALGGVDPMAYTPDLGASLALVKASVLAEQEPEAALALLDKARLLSPGTLVEEAALRRSIAIATGLGDIRRFLFLSEEYVRRYLRSPYASQFADTFVAGVIALHVGLDLAEVTTIAGLMEPEQEKVIYLRIARQAAIDGLTELSAFASGRAEGRDEDARTLLYSSLSGVTSGTVGDVLARLSKIDRDQLSESDRELLDAASAIATGMTAVPEGLPEQVIKARANPVREVGPEPVPAAAAPADDHSQEPVAAPAAGHGQEPVQQAAVQSHSPAPLNGPARSIDAAADETDAMMAATRAKLTDIDKLLGEMPE
ncbi:chemotaxis protein MotC [Mesorhizobium sp. 10J20-29]